MNETLDMIQLRNTLNTQKLENEAKLRELAASVINGVYEEPFSEPVGKDGLKRPTPITDKVEDDFWSHEASTREVFVVARKVERMLGEEKEGRAKDVVAFTAELEREKESSAKMAVQLAAERAKIEQLRWAILSVMPDPPYDFVSDPAMLYCAEALAATEESVDSKESKEVAQ